MTDNFIPVANPGAQVQARRVQIEEAIERVLSSGWFILGNEVKLFEIEFAKFLGADFCVGVANGTDAVSLALLSVGIKPGDEVITVSHTAVATVAAIELIGAVPVFVDINPQTRCLDPDNLSTVISETTKAVVPVHIYGQPAPMEQILAVAQLYRLKVVEDCAQAHGASINGQMVGTFGDAAAFSFYPTKNLGALGDGGAIVTNHAEVAEKARWLREYGWVDRYISSLPGMNSRLDEIQAAILRVKLPYLNQDNARRRAVAESYYDSIDDRNITAPPHIADTEHAMHLFVIECEKRDQLRYFLAEIGIATAVHYPVPIHKQPAYQMRIRGGHRLRYTENLCQRILSLPMHPQLTDPEIEQVCTALIKWSSQQ